MNFNGKVNSTRAFWKKAHNYLRYYPVTHKNPVDILRRSIEEILRIVTSCKSIDNLEPLSKGVLGVTEYIKGGHHCQISMLEEQRRFIIYTPTKLLGTNETEQEVIKLIDLVVVD